MITEELTRYVSEQREAGFDAAIIADVLKKSGWGEEDITLILAATATVPSPSNDATQAARTLLSTHVSLLVLPASLGQRFVNNTIDGIVGYIFTFVITTIVLFSTGGTAPFAFFVAWLSFISYYVLFETLFQRTVGKWVTGTKVVRHDGGKANLWQIIGRTLARLIPFEALSFLFYGNYPTKGWHDRLSGTLVVPKNLTPEEIHSIDQAKISASPQNHVSSIIVIIIVGIPIGLAIVGILASVVLVLLSTARIKGLDAAIESNINNLRAQAAIYYDTNNNTYVGLCDDTMVKMVLSSIQNESTLNPTCSASATAYAVAGRLHTGDMYCVDDNGATTTAIVLPGQTSCTDPRQTVTSSSTMASSTNNATSSIPVTDSPSLSAMQQAIIVSSLDNLRAQAALYYDGNKNTYIGFCNSSSTRTILTSVYETSHAMPICNNALAAYAIAASMGGGTHYCVDDTGFASTTAAAIATQTSCQ